MHIPWPFLKRVEIARRPSLGRSHNANVVITTNVHGHGGSVCNWQTGWWLIFCLLYWTIVQPTTRIAVPFGFRSALCFRVQMIIRKPTGHHPLSCCFLTPWLTQRAKINFAKKMVKTILPTLKSRSINIIRSNREGTLRWDESHETRGVWCCIMGLQVC